MHLQRIRATNFRAFGDGATGPTLDWHLNPALNILVGENDAGKTAVIDAIRHVLWTTSYEFIRLLETDFHIAGRERATTLNIEVALAGLNEDQQSSVLEWLTHEPDGSFSLVIHLQARWLPPRDGKRGKVVAMTRTGRDGAGPEIGMAVRELIRATYLRPLRDAEAELRPGRFSRLSQILGAHPDIAGQEHNDFDPQDDTRKPEKLVGMMAYTQHHLGRHDVVKGVQDDINENYLSKFAFAGDTLASRIQITPDLTLQPILEKFELGLVPSGGIHVDERCVRGLGYNNALFMATELVLLREGDELGLLLIEEPEAHLHPQLQERVQKLLEETAGSRAEGKSPVQVIMTTHSPSMAAGADIRCMTLVHKAHLYKLAEDKTRLKKNDYEFLRRFIDATKANMFFARGVAMVEGPAEVLLLPALAKACGLSFSEYGISMVNVGGVGLYHYARILQRADEAEVIPIPVACLTDRDVVPDAVTYIERNEGTPRFESQFTGEELSQRVSAKVARAEGGNTKVFVSDRWTLEYDLARYGCAELMFMAIQLAKAAKTRDDSLDDGDELQAVIAAEHRWEELSAAGHSEDLLAALIYEPLQRKQASKAVAAQYAAYFLETGQFGAGAALFAKLPLYLRSALTHLTGQAPAI